MVLLPSPPSQAACHRPSQKSRSDSGLRSRVPRGSCISCLSVIRIVPEAYNHMTEAATGSSGLDRAAPALLILDLDEGLTALAAAEACGKPVLLLTPADAGAWLGPDWLESMSRHLRERRPEAEFRLILDCGDRQALAHEALRRGAAGVCFTGVRAAAKALAEIAAQTGAILLTRRPPALELARLPKTRQREEAIRWIGNPEGGGGVD